MRILLAMCVMAYRTGAEMFVRDLALRFNRMGHVVIVYSPVMGEMVEELRAQSIACVTCLDRLAISPDIIVGNTQIETVQCLARFPGVPAISICHDRVASHGQPPLFSRVRVHVAVDANCEERLVLEHGIDPQRVLMIQNGVDTQRFLPRSPLPPKPGRAVIFSNYATPGRETELVRRACSAEGIALDIIGSGTGNLAITPEEVLGNYDLVFAKARCALEAMATGCAVIVLNEGQGMAGMVTSANVAEWRLWNFGRRLLLRQPIDEERLQAEIRRYSAGDAGRVGAYIREHASLQEMAVQFSQLAERVLHEWGCAPCIEPQSEWQEFAQYVTAVVRPPGPAQVAVQVGILQQEMAAVRQGFEDALGNARHEIARLLAEHEGLLKRHREMSDTLAMAQEALIRITEEKVDLQSALMQAHQEREALAQGQPTVSALQEALVQARAACSGCEADLVSVREALAGVVSERDDLLSCQEALGRAVDNVRSELAAVYASRSWRTTAPLRWGLARWLALTGRGEQVQACRDETRW